MRAIHDYFLGMGYRRLSKQIDRAIKKFNKLKGG